MTEIERDLRIRSAEAQVSLPEEFFTKLQTELFCDSWDIFVTLPSYSFKAEHLQLDERACKFLEDSQKRKAPESKESVPKKVRLPTKLEEFVDAHPALKQSAICTVARLCSFARQRLDTVYFTALVVFYLSLMFESFTGEIPDQTEFSRLFARFMANVFERRKKVEFWCLEEAQLAEKARRWKSVLKHSDFLLEPGLFLTDSCPICGEAPSQVDFSYLWPQNAPPPPLAPGVVQEDWSTAKSLALSVYALLLEDNAGELVWFLANLGLALVDTRTVAQVRKHLEETKYAESNHLLYLKHKLLPKLDLIANGEEVKACPFPVSPTPEEASSLALKMGFFPKKSRAGDRGDLEFAKLMEISHLELPAFATTHFRGLTYIWMENGGYQLDRLRKIPHFKQLDQDKQVQHFLELANQGLKGLHALHETKHYHGDIKPTNVVVGKPPSYQWLFIDYSGLDRTPAYMDPSSIHGGSPAPAASTDDTYALLLTILEIVLDGGSPCGTLTGQTPGPAAVKRLYEAAKDSYLKQAFLHLPKLSRARDLFAFFEPMSVPDPTMRRPLTFEGTDRLVRPFFLTRTRKKKARAAAQ